MFCCTCSNVSCLVNTYYQYRKRQCSTTNEMTLKIPKDWSTSQNPWLAKLQTHEYGKTFGERATYRLWKYKNCFSNNGFLWLRQTLHVFVHINLNWNELHIEIRSRNNQNRLLNNSYDFISRYKYIPACTWFLCMCLHNHFHKPKVTLGLIITASHCLQYRFKCTMSMHFIAL